MDVPTIPADAYLADILAEHIGRSRRTLIRWTTKYPQDLPRHTILASDGTPRTLYSWADIIRFCERHDKACPAHPPSAPAGPSLDLVLPGDVSCPVTPDPALSEDVGGATGQAQTGGGGLEEQFSAALEHQEDLQAEVRQLTQALSHTKGRITALEEGHRREIAHLEARIEELKASHLRELQIVREELRARREETTEMRQAQDLLRRQEMVLRLHLSSAQLQRDQALAELQTWAAAGPWQRLFSRPRLFGPELREPETTRYEVATTLVTIDKP